MTLTLITPPVGPVVDYELVMDQCRLKLPEDAHQLSDVIAYEAAAVAHLDGYRGVLGRAILSQVWKQEFGSWGMLRLAMPDVSAITVTALDATGAAVSATRADLRADAMGPYVITEGPAVDRVFVQFTCALPPEQLPAVQVAIRMLAAHWFGNREAVGPGAMAEMPLAVDALIAPLRWGRM